MSINSAMLSGVSGLIANSAALGAISDNIANVNTVGYKENSTQFEDLVTSKATQGNYNSGGVQANVTQLVSQQGQFTQTQSSTDLAISGNGFFVVSTTPAGLSATSGPEFTRAGSFTPDSAGDLKNSAGLYLQGWVANASGAITTSPSDLTKLSTINVNSIGNSPDPTTTASINANLDATTAVSTPASGGTYSAASATTSMNAYDAAVAAGTSTTGMTKPDYSTQTTVYDTQGGAHTVQIDFLKSSTPDTWDVEVNVIPASQTTGTGQIAAGTVTFDANGAFKSTTLPSGTSSTSPSLALTVPWAASTGLSSQALTLNLGGASGDLTQYASASTTNATTVDGGPAGTLSNVSVGTDGKVTANFSNGASRTIAQVAIATFADPDGLAAASGNAYTATDDSGTFNLQTAGTGGAGKVQSSQLEASTVDLSTEFTNLIITQRAYSAASKIITTADQMLQELISIKQ